MPSTAIVWFTRDLRVHDHPALTAACAEADRVVPVFVLDDDVLGAGGGAALPIASPNKVAILLHALEDLTSAMRDRGGALVKRRGSVADELGRLAAEVGADVVHTTADSSAYARRRLDAVREALDVEVVTHPGLHVHEPGEVTTTSGGHYKVFTPYHRAWSAAPLRPVLEGPGSVPTPSSVAVGRVPSLADLLGEDAGDRLSPDLGRGGEIAGRELAEGWLADDVGGYEDGHDDLAGDRTSRLSPHLHLGTVSPVWLVDRADGRGPGAVAFVRQLAWRDYHTQVLADRPEVAWEDVRSQGDRWRDDDEALEAWQAGRTGYPIVDAGMRQLRREGWIHNRARLLVASFLTRDLYLDWRAGARHFLDWLADGDIANNQLNWQWVSGTGTVSRPNRAFNPTTQAERYDPRGDYVRRYVPELRPVEGGAVHRPWDLPEEVRAELGYPDPVVDHAEAMARFRRARGID